MLTGGCLCGAIGYTISAPVTGLRACHCLNCQKASGAGGTVNAVVPTDSFKITKGTTRRYDDTATHSGRGNIWTSTARPWHHIDPAAECHPGNLPAPPPKA